MKTVRYLDHIRTSELVKKFFSRLFLTLDFFVQNLELVAAAVKLNAFLPENHLILDSGERVSGQEINLSLILMGTIWGNIFVIMSQHCTHFFGRKHITGKGNLQ